MRVGGSRDNNNDKRRDDNKRHTMDGVRSAGIGGDDDEHVCDDEPVGDDGRVGGNDDGGGASDVGGRGVGKGRRGRSGGRLVGFLYVCLDMIIFAIETGTSD